MGRGVREANKRDRQSSQFSRADLQRCIVCQRWFIRRRDNVCSVSCLEKKAKAQAMEGSTPGGP
jgi:hypothetical protein